MNKLVAIIYKSFADRGPDLPHFRTIGILGFCLFIHLAQLAVICRIDFTYFILWDPLSDKGIQWVFAAIYFGIIWLVLALVFKKHKLDEIGVTKTELRKGKRLLAIYLVLSIILLLVLLLKLGIEKGAIKV